ncbi:MAG: large repetitive protein, partial [Thermoleophilaceae bacterium]|nr:large repetitive protein [Thermoleophilaceae bacterium]
MACAAALALALPAAARAADVTIGFDDLPPGTEVTSQYHDTGGPGRGVDFGVDQTGQPEIVAPHVQDVGSQAHSGTRIATLFNCDKEFCFNDVEGRFTQTKQFVRIFVGSNGAAATVKLTVYHTDNTSTVKQVGVPAAPAGYKTQLEIDSPQPDIASFRVEGGYGMDDFTFDNPVTPPPADFALIRDTTGNYDPTGDVGVVKGKSTDVKIDVNRYNGSSGPISYSVSGLPSGVSASFSPPSPNAAGVETMTLTASPGAATASGAPVTVTGTPSSAGVGPAARTAQFPLNVFGNYDVRVTGIEVTQGIQKEVVPCGDPVSCGLNVSLPAKADPNSTAPVPYNGVHLAAGGKTVARVFANVKTPVNGKVDSVDAVLHGFDSNGHELPGSPLSSDLGPRTLNFGNLPFVTFANRADPLGSYYFTLPDSWAQGTLSLKAELVPPLTFVGTAEAECETANCLNNNKFTLAGIPFSQMRPVQLSLVKFFWQGEDGSKFIPLGGGDPRFFPCGQDVLDASPSSTFTGSAATLTPLGEGQLGIPACDYEGTIDITALHNATTIGDLVPGSQCEIVPSLCATAIKDGDDFKNGIVKGLLDDWVDDHPFCKKRSCADLTLGVNQRVARGVSSGKLPNGDEPVAITDYSRPLTSVGHELFHGYGRAHASKCTNGGDPGTTEDWPPDQQGFIQGVGLDRRAGSGAQGSAYRIIADGALGAPAGIPGFGLGQPSRYFDLMGYCADVNEFLNFKPGNEHVPDVWIGFLGWEATWLDLLPPEARCGFLGIPSFLCAKRAVRPRASTAPMLTVRAFGDSDGHAIITAVTESHVVAPKADPGSPFHLQAFDAAGNKTIDVPMTIQAEHVNRGGNLVNLIAQIPGTTGGIGRLAITGGSGQVLGGVKRSPHSPVLRLTRPRKGQVVGRGRNTVLGLKATDADHDPLTIKVDYSADDGHNWRSVYVGFRPRRIVLPSAVLSASRKARLRVFANDGFNETAVTSARFRALGRPPTVRITSPSSGERIADDAPAHLSGQAFDDAFQQLGGRHMQWFSHGRRLGSGASINPVGLRPGRNRITLVARDALGRLARASVTVRVLAVPPQFLRVQAPPRVGTATKRVTLKVAASMPSTLRVGKARFAVGRKARAVRIRIR